MKIDYIGYNHTHGADFEINRPDGSGNYLLLLFRTPAFMQCGDRKIDVARNSFVIFEKGRPQHYGSCGEAYADDWIHFTLEDGEESFFSEHGLELNVPVYAGSLAEQSEMVRSMCFEHIVNAEYTSESMNLYMRLLLIKLCRRTAAGGGLSEADSKLFYSLNLIRERLYSDPSAAYSVEALAAEASMSRSYFQHTYKRLFGKSVRDDIITGRISHAQTLLAATDMTVREVSESCGYENHVHFMRQFKERTGMTPTEYRSCF